MLKSHYTLSCLHKKYRVHILNKGKEILPVHVVTDTVNREYIWTTHHTTLTTQTGQIFRLQTTSCGSAPPTKKPKPSRTGHREHPEDKLSSFQNMTSRRLHNLSEQINIHETVTVERRRRLAATYPMWKTTQHSEKTALPVSYWN